MPLASWVFGSAPASSAAKAASDQLSSTKLRSRSLRMGKAAGFRRMPVRRGMSPLSAES